jgi:hypothetical protein
MPDWGRKLELCGYFTGEIGRRRIWRDCSLPRAPKLHPRARAPRIRASSRRGDDSYNAVGLVSSASVHGTETSLRETTEGPSPSLNGFFLQKCRRRDGVKRPAVHALIGVRAGSLTRFIENTCNICISK